MSQTLPMPPPGFDELSSEEQMNYVDALWTYVISHTEHVQIPEWHREIISERINRYLSDIEGATTWEEFEKELNKT